MRHSTARESGWRTSDPSTGRRPKSQCRLGQSVSFRRNSGVSASWSWQLLPSPRRSSPHAYGRFVCKQPDLFGLAAHAFLRPLLRFLSHGAAFTLSRFVVRFAPTKEIALQSRASCGCFCVIRGRLNLSLNACLGDDDRMWKAFRTCSGLTEGLIGFEAAGTRIRDFLQLHLDLVFWQLPPFEPVAGFDHLFNIQFEDIAPPIFAGRPLPPSQEQSQPPPALT